MGQKRSKPATVTLPKPGDVFMMPLGDSRFGVCRVLRENSEEERKGHGAPYVLVAASPWIGSETPDLGDTRLREIQTLSHHSWKNGPNILWVSMLPPEDYRLIGTIKPSPADKRRQCSCSGGWAFAYQVLTEWRWGHDRDAVLREDAERAEKQAQEYKEFERRRREARGALTLEMLWKKRRFSDWKGYAPDNTIVACRVIFRKTVGALLALGKNPDESVMLPILQGCIEQLNQLDEENGHFIETTIREDLCEDFSEIAEACGLRDCDDLAERWRDW
jgi:hypothetical protein